MKNFIFISPNFPLTYWRFCKELKNNIDPLAPRMRSECSTI